MITLPVEADDEHGPSVPVAGRLIGCEHWRVSAFGRGVADPFAKAAVTELVCTAKKVDGKVGSIRSQRRLHGMEMLIAKGQDVRPHAKRV